MCVGLRRLELSTIAGRAGRSHSLRRSFGHQPNQVAPHRLMNPTATYSSSAARLATALRSHEVSVTWPKQRCPPNAWISTASALFDSPR